MSRLPTPPTVPPSLVLCADGGGSKVCVVIRTEDGVEVRGTAGPCNVQSVGFPNAAQAILLATYRALAQLPRSYLPKDFSIPPLPEQESTADTGHNTHPSPRTVPSTPFTSRTPSPRPNGPLPGINVPIFAAAWLGLAGVNTADDANSFAPYVPRLLNIPQDKIKVSNDVNLLAAPALEIPNIRHVVAVVCGTGTVGRTLRISHSARAPGAKRALPLEDVAVSRGWGYLLCDEGSAFWIGRLAIRALLSHADRHASSQIYSTPPPALLPFHNDLLAYFGVPEPMGLIELISHTGRWIEGAGGDAGQVASRRNAMLAGAARIVLRWAFPEDQDSARGVQPPSPPPTSTTTPIQLGSQDPIVLSQQAALSIAKNAIVPLIDLTMCLLGDRTITKPEESALALGGGLMMSKGYRGLLLEGLRREGVEWGSVQVISDAAGAGAIGLAAVEFAK